MEITIVHNTSDFSHLTVRLFALTIRVGLDLVWFGVMQVTFNKVIQALQILST